MGKIRSLLKHQFLLLILMAILTIPAILPLTKPGFFPTQDFIHVARLYEMDKEIKDFQFPVRWVSDFRYGDPTFNFYAPLPFYIGSLIHGLNFNFLNTTKILFGASFLLSGLTMFFLAKELFGKPGGLVSAVLYIYAPYHSVDVYVRGALSESLALIFFPLIFLSALRLSKKPDKKNIAFLALSLAGLFLTHNIMTILFFPFFIGWTFFLIWSKRKFNLIKYFLLSILLGLGLASTFLLPAFFEKDFVQSQAMITGYFDYRGHFVEIKQFFSTFWGYGASLWGAEDGMSFQVGIANWLVLALSLFLVFVLRKDREKIFLILFLCLEFLFSLFMQHNKSTPIWLQFPILAYTQFPWRFLGVSIFLLALIGGSVAVYLKGKLVLFTPLIILGAILLSINFFHPESYYYDSTDNHYVGPKVLAKEDNLPKDYLPVWVKTFSQKINTPHTTSGKAFITDFKYRSTQSTFKINVLEDSDIETPVTFFPGWEVRANGKLEDIESPDKYGLIRFKLPKGEYLVQMKLVDTPVRRAGNVISIATFFVLLGILIGKKLKLKLWLN